MPPPPQASAGAGGDPTAVHAPPWASLHPGNSSQAGTQTYAAAIKAKRAVPRLKPVDLVHRPLTYVDKIPALVFTSIEEDQLCRQRENTLIMKFSTGKPRTSQKHGTLRSSQR